jgi:hypothetical protein
MELFAKLFSSLLVFVYHCFDRIVIHGYLSGLSRPEQVVYFFRDVIGVPVVDKAVLSKRTGEYRGWVEAFARNHKIPMEWAEKGVRKEDYVRPWLRRMTAHKISEIFGVRVTKKLKGKLNTTLEQIEHGHHIFRAYFKHAFVKQYEKFSTFLRNEICSNNLSDFGLKKGLEHLAAVREKFLAIADRFATFQAQCLNVHVEFPLLQRLALPIAVGTAKFPGIKIHDTRMIRLMEVLLHGGITAGEWTAKQIHDAIPFFSDRLMPYSV